MWCVVDCCRVNAGVHHFVCPRPIDNVRYDGIGYWPVHDKGLCRLCRKGWSHMKCLKCETMLCFTGDNPSIAMYAKYEIFLGLYKITCHPKGLIDYHIYHMDQTLKGGLAICN